MFRVLLAHPQQALHKLNLAYCVRIMSVGCGADAVKLQPRHSRFRGNPAIMSELKTAEEHKNKLSSFSKKQK
jgi:hypothetical protein